MIPFLKSASGTIDPSTKHSSQPVTTGWDQGGFRLETRPRRTLIVGAGAVGRELARNLQSDSRCQIVGFIDDEMDLPGDEEHVVLGRRDEIVNVVEEYLIDQVFVAYAPSWQQRAAEELAATHPDVKISVVPTSFESMLNMSSVSGHGDIAVVQLLHAQGRCRELFKRAFDISLAFLALILLAPFLLLVTALIKIVSPGPVIFSQDRIGRNNKPFTLYKFRTMVHNAEANTGPVLANGKNDPRLTAVGRWLRLCRIDEIPQLWNVLKGDMSLVGPRPERPYFVKKYQQMIPTYAMRHQVRPGITGLAQVYAGYHTDARDKLRFDLIYASHQSVLLDLIILFRTFTIMVLPQRYNWGP
ncbi:MAG: sugar transferase [Armatimonadetes bacterium]|nr:sugar transferase [Armatimonadota bacterium]